jgi:hypothetical protein
MMIGIRPAAVGAAVVAAAALCSCTSGGAGTPSRTTASGSHLDATRWWSNSAAKAGSSIDPAHPAAAVGKLHRSADDYCSMLRQTVSAGKSILPGVTANDPALLASTKAFTAEIEQVAPKRIASSWQVVGDAVVAIVASGGELAKVKHLDAGRLRSAADTIADDAKTHCKVNVSAAAP